MLEIGPFSAQNDFLTIESKPTLGELPGITTFAMELLKPLMAAYCNQTMESANPAKAWRSFWWVGHLQNRGDRTECLAAQSVILAIDSTLIPPVVAADSLDFAVANALVRLHLDKGLDLHPNGVSNDSWNCPLVHIMLFR